MILEEVTGEVALLVEKAIDDGKFDDGWVTYGNTAFAINKDGDSGGGLVGWLKKDPSQSPVLAALLLSLRQ